MRIIEIGHIVAGPTAGLILSDLGHEVIKIERPGSGDIARSLTGTSAGAFPFYNRNKKSLTLDIKKEEGRKIFFKLIRDADVLIDNLGYGALENLGLTYSRISQENEGLIYLSIRGYGDGPYERRKSLDFPIEIHSGLAYMNGVNGHPLRAGASLIDMSAAMFGVIAILNAVIEREVTGKGKKITVGMFETATFFIGQHIATYQITGKELKPLNEEGFAWGVYDFFRTSDNKDIFIAVTTDEQWKTFSSLLKIDFGNNFETNAERYERRNILIPKLSAIILEKSLDEMVTLLNKGNISYAIMNKPWELLEDPHASQKMVKEFYNSKDLRVPCTPIACCNIKNPPKLGENNEEILQNLGYTIEEIGKLKSNKII